MSVTIKEIKYFWQREAFIRFPESLYAGFPAYCMQIFDEQRKFVSPRHPFRKHGDAAFFMAYQGGKPVARAMVSYDPTLKSRGGVAVAHVGLFECIDDIAVSRKILSHCVTWAKDKHQVTHIRGPVDYSLNYTIGMYLGPYDAPQRFMMNYNPPYYPNLWEDFGFKKEIDFFSWWGETPVHIDKWVDKVRRIGHNSPIKIRHLTKKSFVADMLRAHALIGKILEGNPGYVPMTAAEYKKFVKELAMFVPGELIWIAEDQGAIVGVSLTLPDFNESIRPLRGRLFPWGLPTGIIRFYSGIKHIKTARVGLLGIHPDYRFEGVAERMMIETLMIGREKFNFKSAEIGWTFEDNVAMINNVEKLGTELKKTYRIYGLDV